MSIKFSVIIVTYLNIDLVKQCLNSIQRYNDIGNELEVIISDNSPDNSVIEFCNQFYPNVKTIKNKNIGFGAGNNIGVLQARGKYLFFLNPDTILIEPIFKKAINYFEKDKDLALFGAQLLSEGLNDNPSFYLIDKFGILPSLIEKICRKKHIYIDGKMYIAGADMFVRKDIFYEAGMFDETFFMYDEEPDLIKRIKAKCKVNKTAFYDNLKIIHLEGGTTVSLNKELTVRKHITTTDILYAKKWGLDIISILKSKRRYVKFKQLIYLVTFRFEKSKSQQCIVKFFDNQIKMLGDF